MIWAAVLALVLLRAAVISVQPLPLAPGDPARLLVAPTAPPELALQGWLLADPRPSADGSRCTALMQLLVGRTELQFSPCPDPAPQEGPEGGRGRRGGCGRRRPLHPSQA